MVIDNGKCPHVETCRAIDEELLRGRRDRRRIESATHQDADAIGAEAVADRGAKQLFETIDVIT